MTFCKWETGRWSWHILVHRDHLYMQVIVNCVATSPLVVTGLCLFVSTAYRVKVTSNATLAPEWKTSKIV